MKARQAFTGAALLLLAVPLTAQAPGDRIAEVRDGTVRLAFNHRPDVCGDGTNVIRVGKDNVFQSGEDRGVACIPGPARVRVTRSGGRTTEVKVYVGGGWPDPSRGTTDLGLLPAPAAARALVALAARDEGAEDAVFAATLADSVVIWPDLMALARQGTAPAKCRRAAIFWLGQAAAEAVTAGLVDIAEEADTDREIREAAVFAISQRPNDEAVPTLIRLARSSSHASVRKQAIFWLGQSDDPRALGLIEEILSTR
ncbi:MAG: HEAT repeat domain-containing protein [Gemmatimonadales bacterium]